MNTHSQKYVDFFHTILKLPFVTLDTETTGLHHGEVCEIAIVNSVTDDRYCQRIKTKNPIPRDAIAIHGITDEDVKDCPTWPEVLPTIQALLTGTNVIVYNAVYDRKMLHQSSELWLLPHIEWKALSPWHCAMEAFAEMYGDYNEYRGTFKWQKLSTAAAYFNLVQVGAHGALQDALTTMMICKEWAKMPF